MPVSYDSLRLERREDLLFVTLDNPSRANALSPLMVGELAAVYGRDWRTDGVRAILLAGEGKHFSAGADLAHLESLREATAEQNLEEADKLRQLFESILRQEALTVAAVQGACVAGGCGLATANDFVVAAEGSRFMYSEVRIGFVAALVATYLPLRLRGTDLREVLLNPEFLSAERALEIGLVNRVVPADRLAEEAEALASGILERASSESIARTKRLLLELYGRELGDAFQRAARANAEARSTDDCRRGVSAFLETKSTPDWRS